MGGGLVRLTRDLNRKEKYYLRTGPQKLRSRSGSVVMTQIFGYFNHIEHTRLRAR